jgi:hypothetical protein
MHIKYRCVMLILFIIVKKNINNNINYYFNKDNNCLNYLVCIDYLHCNVCLLLIILCILHIYVD